MAPIAVVKKDSANFAVEFRGDRLQGFSPANVLVFFIAEGILKFVDFCRREIGRYQLRIMDLASKSLLSEPRRRPSGTMLASCS
ncbi:hypothetical protein PY650_11315 [Rhizobium calliandrae]|uniref:Uncharacterized protein n=1 Tax=Rhizobium calliandrae TaxID=1312182 RepID=A0ABT7KCE1_9HYPH|nr:hypothetical protein [Rhizobium calliandrae]MDL2406237.1 hypothetical protein [Rhizobium calliandrae]